MKARLFLIVLSLTTVRTLGQGFDSLISPGPLSRAHSELAGLGSCEKCHTPGQGITARKCLSCHTEVQERIVENRGLHRDRAEACGSCHPEHRGEEADLINWEPSAFDHDQSGFPLVGLHARVDRCEVCHTSERFARSDVTRSFLLGSADCVTCHEDVHHGQLGNDCRQCHSENEPFKSVRFDHDRADFQLRGAHRSVACAHCHEGGKWKDVAHSQCLDCHTDRHRPSLGNDCTQCHTVDAWQVPRGLTRFHGPASDFPLLGRHASLSCEKCHNESRFRGIAFAECRDCHTVDPHLGQFRQDCASCHTVEGFKQSLFRHESSSFPLTGRHAGVECVRCHPNEIRDTESARVQVTRYRPISRECSSCHKDIHLGQFAMACVECHTTGGFGLSRLTFSHERDSAFRIEGRHTTLECSECHRQERSRFPAGEGTAVRFAPIGHQCLTCHQDAHDGQLGARCERCHTVEERFSVAPRFAHQATAFPLDGRHSLLECRSCHPSQDAEAIGSAAHIPRRYRPIATACRECHIDPHRREESRRCADCHSTADFAVDYFNHFKTSFPLVGRHASVTCDQCHEKVSWKAGTVLVFDRQRDGCGDCHQSPHRSHYEECQRCHSPISWRIADF